MSPKKLALYGEKYLHYVHRQGYPTREEKKYFDRRFYAMRDDYGIDGKEAVKDLHQHLKMDKVPTWVWKNSKLFLMYKAVVKDFKEKYTKPSETQKNEQFLPVLRPVTIQVNPEERRAERSTPAPSTDRQEPVAPVAPSENNKQVEKSPRIDQIMEEEEEIMILEEDSHWKWPTSTGIKQEARVSSVQETVQAINPKREINQEMVNEAQGEQAENSTTEVDNLAATSTALPEQATVEAVAAQSPITQTEINSTTEAIDEEIIILGEKPSKRRRLLDIREIKREVDDEEIIVLGSQSTRPGQVKQETAAHIAPKSEEQWTASNSQVKQETSQAASLPSRLENKNAMEERLSLLEKELTASRQKLLEEKRMNNDLMNQIIYDKERTIQLMFNMVSAPSRT